MAHINTPKGIPGIRSLVLFRPETGRHLYDIAQVLLRGPSPLSCAERELIATHVSALNDCMFCMNSHAAAARELYRDDGHIVDCVIHNRPTELLTPKMKSLLIIAGKTQQSGKLVAAADIAEARQHGASDLDIHDAVLIAAAFSMFNRYVDGLASATPVDPKDYEIMGKHMATVGYALPKQPGQ